MRRFMACFAVMGALAVAMPGSAWAQSGNVGGTIGKKDKTVTGGDQPAITPARKTRATAAAPKASGCRALVGSWSWPFGNSVFKADRSVRHSMGNTGKWSCAGATVVINWDHGVVDRAILSPDGPTLSVASGVGISFQSKRN